MSANEGLRTTLARLLERHPGIGRSGTAAAASGALDFVSGCPTDVVVSDAAPGSLDQVLTWRQVRGHGPRLIMLTNYLRDADTVRAILAGASGLILTAAHHRTPLLKALDTVSAGLSLMPPGTTTRLSAIATGEAPSRLQQEERDVLALILDSHTDREIEARLGIAQGAVTGYVTELAAKLVD